MAAKKRLPKGFAELDVGALSESDRMNILMLAEKAAVYGATKRQTLGNPQQTKAFVSAQLRSKQSEVFLVIFLDSQHGVLASEEMFQGTIDGCSVYPREVVKRALEVNAAALVLAHPHPSGEPEPSLADRQITRRLIDALALVDIRVLDHIVVGSGKAVSFAERGLM